MPSLLRRAVTPDTNIAATPVSRLDNIRLHIAETTPSLRPVPFEKVGDIFFHISMPRSCVVCSHGCAHAWPPGFRIGVGLVP